MAQTSSQQQIGSALFELLKNMIQKTSLAFTKDPETAERNIVEYASRMRVGGLEKFNAPAFVAAVNFYRTPADEKAHNACGALVLFFDEESVPRFLKGMGLTGFRDDDDEMVLQKSGEFCVSVAEAFKSELTKFGFSNLTVSKPIVHRNDIAEGLPFPYDQYKYTELSFHLWKKKVFVANCVVA